LIVRRVGSVVLALALALTGCTGHSENGDDDVVVVSVDYLFGSLNAATAAGTTPGSTMVRGLVQTGFFTTDDDGTIVANTSFGTVEKISDAPLTVQYTIATDATWSDGVPVTSADLLLEWAARSGQLDEIVPVVGGDGRVPEPPDADQSVAFWAASPALVHVQAIPTTGAQTLTLVYSTPVADWATALDVNVPAHVVGRLALDGRRGSPTPTTALGWADLVASAIVSVDRDALVPVSRQWRSFGTREALAADPGLAVTTGPYRIAEVSDERVEMVLNEHYTGERPGSVATVVVRTDLDPLAQLRAVRSGTVDLAVPMSTPDVRAAADDDKLAVSTSGGAVLQLWLGEQPTSPFAGGSALANRTAFVGALNRAELARTAEARASDVVLAQVGPTWQPPAPGDLDPGDGEPEAGEGEPAEQPEQPADEQAEPEAPPEPPAPRTPAVSPTSRVPVRLLVDTNDPVRAALAEAITEQVSAVGFDVTLVTTDITVALWSQPGRWDVALVPVTQEPLPVSAIVARWRTNGAANVTHHSDDALDATLDALVAQADPARTAAGLAAVASSVTARNVVVPLVHQPLMSVVATTSTPVTPPNWAACDLSAWWAWLP